MKRLPVGVWLGIVEALAQEWGLSWVEAAETTRAFFPAVEP
ncbi:MAG: hypothetical protein SF051_05390 [Elusimicrobiota bacterium]|nr:hypothetical protein [Elusimicrobiota bacterium]